MSVDLPEPETPVMHAKTPSGRSTSIFLRLCWRAPPILIDDDHLRRNVGTGIDFRPVRYSRVRDGAGAPSRRLCDVLRREGAPAPLRNSSSGPLLTNSPPPS